MVICLERGADCLHMVQLMPLPLTVSCFSKIQIGLPFLVPAHLGSPQKRAVKRVCVCVCVCVVGQQSILMSMSVFVYGLSVCLQVYLQNYKSNPHKNFSACYQWPWVDPLLATLQ